MLLLAASRLEAQPSATVPASSAVYERLESVVALFPTRGVHLGVRPLSRRDLARIVERLSRSVEAAPPRDTTQQRWARRELADVSASLSDELGLHGGGGRHVLLREGWRGDVFASDALSERMTSNGLGEIDAITHPATPRRHGWPAVRGSAMSLAPSGVLGFGERVAVAVEPRVSIVDVRDTGRTATIAFAHRAYARGVVRNVALQLGADERLWGQSPVGALFISGNAPPLRALTIGSDTPITLPWLFRVAGPTHMKVLIADLGSSQDPPHAKLAGWHVTMQPWPRFELGVAMLAQTGGGDSLPDVSFLQRLADLLPVLGSAFPQYDNPISNKLAGGHLRWRVPALSGLDVYYELQLDDFDGRRLRSSFVDDAGHLLGARLPIHVAGGQLSWRAEWHKTSIRLYEHSQFKSGVTHDSRIIGNPLGPHAIGGYLEAVWKRSPSSAVAIAVADERRDPSLFTTPASVRDTAFRFVRVTDDPRYRRRGATLSLERPLDFGALRFTLGYNRAWRTGQTIRNEWLAALAVRSHHLPTF